MTLSQYTIYAFWGPRAESPKALAARFIQLIDQLALLHPAFNGWTWVSMDRIPTPFEQRRHDLAQAIAANVTRDDWGEPEPQSGYNAGVVNTVGKAVTSSISVGANAGDQSWNSAHIETGWRVEPDPSIVTYGVFKSALLALAEIYEVDWCSAYPIDIMGLWPKDKAFCMPWMCYIKPAWAPLITPPRRQRL